MQYCGFLAKKRTEEELTREAREALNELVQGSSWFCFQDGFWQWIAERIMRQKFYTLKPYGLRYALNIWRGLGENEKMKFRTQYERERREWLNTGRLPRS